MKFIERVRKSWNVFNASEKEDSPMMVVHQPSSFRRPDRVFRSTVRGKEITNAIYNRIATDCASVDIRHVRLDEARRFASFAKNSSLDNCLNLEANIDQSGFAFRNDIFQSLLEEGTIAILPIETDTDPNDPTSTNILAMRVATIVNWYPSQVRVRAFRQEHQRYEEITVPKKFVAIVENPFYSVMNEQNSTLQRLTRKISLLDAVDEQIGSGKLDLIIQLPYIVKGDTKRAQAERRRAELEEQLQSSQYGVAYADGTEKIVQLNRPVENNLLKNVESLTKLLYTQLGITEEIINGTASEETMLNYQTRIVKPLVKSVVEAMQRNFLSQTARSQGQSLQFFLDVFSLVPISKFADIADKLSRNAILTPNELRQIIGFPPAAEPIADELSNKNMPHDPSLEEPPLEEPLLESDVAPEETTQV